MPVTDLFMIGKTTVPSSWIALVIAYIVGVSIVRIQYGKKGAEKLIDYIFYFVVVWKFSVIITDFESVIKMPLSIIYFDGGLVGFYLGLLVVGVTILIDVKRNKIVWIDCKSIFVGFVTIQSVYQVMMALLNEGTLVAKVMTVVFFTSFMLVTWFMIKKGEQLSSQFVLLFIAMHFFVAAFQPAGVMGTSVLATLFIGLIFLVLRSWKGRLHSEAEGYL